MRDHKNVIVCLPDISFFISKFCFISLQNGILTNFSILYVSARSYASRAGALTNTDHLYFLLISVWGWSFSFSKEELYCVVLSEFCWWVLFVLDGIDRYCIDRNCILACSYMKQIFLREKGSSDFFLMTWGGSGNSLLGLSWIPCLPLPLYTSLMDSVTCIEGESPVELVWRLFLTLQTSLIPPFCGIFAIITKLIGFT